MCLHTVLFFPAAKESVRSPSDDVIRADFGLNFQFLTRWSRVEILLSLVC